MLAAVRDGFAYIIGGSLILAAWLIVVGLTARVWGANVTRGALVVRPRPTAPTQVMPAQRRTGPVQFPIALRGGLCALAHWVPEGARVCVHAHPYAPQQTREAGRAQIEAAKQVHAHEIQQTGELNMQRLAAGGW